MNKQNLILFSIVFFILLFSIIPGYVYAQESIPNYEYDPATGRVTVSDDYKLQQLGVALSDPELQKRVFESIPDDSPIRKLLKNFGVILPPYNPEKDPVLKDFPKSRLDTGVVENGKIIYFICKECASSYKPSEVCPCNQPKKTTEIETVVIPEHPSENKKNNDFIAVTAIDLNHIDLKVGGNNIGITKDGSYTIDKVGGEKGLRFEYDKATGTMIVRDYRGNELTEFRNAGVYSIRIANAKLGNKRYTIRIVYDSKNKVFATETYLPNTQIRYDKNGPYVSYSKPFIIKDKNGKVTGNGNFNLALNNDNACGKLVVSARVNIYWYVDWLNFIFGKH
ncbi:MAG: hypothetical protein V1870_03055 [Candidatus Aenigmatarchaeota archaeon]